MLVHFTSQTKILPKIQVFWDERRILETSTAQLGEPQI